MIGMKIWHWMQKSSSEVIMNSTCFSGYCVLHIRFQAFHLKIRLIQVSLDIKRIHENIIFSPPQNLWYFDRDTSNWIPAHISNLALSEIKVYELNYDKLRLECRPIETEVAREYHKFFRKDKKRASETQ